MRLLIALLLVPALAIGGCDRQSEAPPQANAATQANAAAPASEPGAAGKPDRSHKGEAAPSVGFTDPAGRPVTLAAFQGKPLLLNLWATFCIPCIKEMPMLDALAGELEGKVQVLAVSQDLKGAEKVGPFFAQRSFAKLQPYLDMDANLSATLSPDLPTTILYDSAGREVWRMIGDADWTSAASKALVAEAQ